MQTMNIAQAKAKLSDVVNLVCVDKKRIVLARRHHPSAVVLGYEDYRHLEALEDAFESALLKKALSKKKFYLLEELVSRLNLEL